MVAVLVCTEAAFCWVQVILHLGFGASIFLPCLFLVGDAAAHWRGTGGELFLVAI